MENLETHVIYSLLLMAIIMLTIRHDYQTKLYKTNNDSVAAHTKTSKTNYLIHHTYQEFVHLYVTF